MKLARSECVCAQNESSRARFSRLNRTQLHEKSRELNLFRLSLVRHGWKERLKDFDLYTRTWKLGTLIIMMKGFTWKEKTIVSGPFSIRDWKLHHTYRVATNRLKPKHEQRALFEPNLSTGKTAQQRQWDTIPIFCTAQQFSMIVVFISQ